MARSKHDGATFAWATNLASTLQQRFDSTWWYQAASQYADSLSDPGNVQSFQKHWIGQTPMEAELHVNGQTVPGLAPFDHGDAALAGRENDCFSGTPPFNPGLFHTGCGGGAERAGREGHLRPDDVDPVDRRGQLRPARRRASSSATPTRWPRPMFGEPATGGTPDEQPGAMPEIFPSPDQGANIDRCWTCRSMFMQAWGNYGTAWAGRAPVAGRAARISGNGLVDVRSAGAAGPDLGAGTGHPARAGDRPTCSRPTTGTPTAPRSRQPASARTR